MPWLPWRFARTQATNDVWTHKTSHELTRARVRQNWRKGLVSMNPVSLGNPTLETVGCLLCGSENRQLLFNTILPVSRCNDCGFVYTSSQPKSVAMSSVYPLNYMPHHPKPVRGHLRGRFRALLRPYLGGTEYLIRPPGRLLDIGCGAGDLLREMALKGWNVHGVELVQTSAEIAAKYGEIVCGSWEAAIERWPPHSFDLITMIHSLEHLHDPLRAVQTLRTLLRHDGRIIIEVPSVKGLFTRLRGAPYYGLPYHLSHFTPSTLKRLLRQSGYRVVRQRYVFSPSEPSVELAQLFGPRLQKPLHYALAVPTALVLCLVRLSVVISVEAAPDNGCA